MAEPGLLSPSAVAMAAEDFTEAEGGFTAEAADLAVAEDFMGAEGSMVGPGLAAGFVVAEDSAAEQDSALVVAFTRGFTTEAWATTSAEPASVTVGVGEVGDGEVGVGEVGAGDGV